MEVAMMSNENNNTNHSIKNNGYSVDVDSLIDRVKTEDEKNLRMTKSFVWIYIVLVIIYAGLIVFNPDPDITIIKRISGLSYIASMLGFAWIFRNGYKEFKSIDYSLPVIEMLRNVAKRYQLKVSKFLILSIPILLMDVGLTLSFYNNLLPMTPINRVLIIQVFYIPIMTISGYIGILVWRKKQKPLRDNALELLKELEN